MSSRRVKKEIPTVTPITVTIVGGGGYIGYHIGVALFQKGHNVTLFDISQPDSFWLEITGMTEEAVDIGDTSWSDGKIIYKRKSESNGQGQMVKNAGVNILKFVRGSLLDMEALETALNGVDCVIHCASYGMSGKEQMPSQWSLTEQVNITGIENVLKACQSLGVRALVYTSSFNVVFGGQPIIDGDESLPYFPLHRHEDHYSRTKCIAERLVLFSDNLVKPSKREPERPLRTCALRLAGVMGLGEKRHLPRIVDYFDFMFFRYGYGDNSLQQFVTIKNVVQAHVKCAENLIKFPDQIGGQAYFISDGIPINSFEFLRPLREALGYKQPELKMPMWVIWGIVYLIRMTHSLLFSIHPRLSFPPMLTTAEVYKTAVTHYFSSDKAERDFGYRPENPNDISDAIQYFCEKKKEKREKSLPLLYIKVILITCLLIALMYFLF